MQCCLEPFGQHCIEIRPVQSCPKSIKKTLHRFFSYAKLAGVSRETLHRVFSCATLCLELLYLELYLLVLFGDYGDLFSDEKFFKILH